MQERKARLLMSILSGDLLFYTAQPRSKYPAGLNGTLSYLTDATIASETGSHYVHVEIVYNATASLSTDRVGIAIAALSQGVVKHPIDYTYTKRAEFSPGQLPNAANALAWLQGEVGHPYGWLDILNQGLLHLPGNPTIAMHSAYDCSDLATRFLSLAGYQLPDYLVVAPQSVTPGELAAALQAQLQYP